MGRKIVKKKTFWLATSLAMLCLLVLFHNFTIEKAEADYTTDTPATSVTVGNAVPTISTVIFNNGNSITLNEWTQASSGTTTATTTFTVTDTNGCTDISTTTLYVFQSEANCSSTNDLDIVNCYPSTSTDSGWNPRYDHGALCDRTSCSGNNATFWCTTTLYYVASTTDGVEPIWVAYASSSDLAYAQVTKSGTAEINALQALAVSNDIAYATLSSGQDSNNSWVTTTATSTGNTIIDLGFHGGSLTKAGDDSVHIPAFKQQFTTTSALTYGQAASQGSVVTLATSTTGSTGDTHDVTMKKATTTSPSLSCADNILWGIGIPSGQAAGSYASSTSFVVKNAIVSP